MVWIVEMDPFYGAKSRDANDTRYGTIYFDAIYLHVGTYVALRGVKAYGVVYMYTARDESPLPPCMARSAAS
jgi:hypothetical protein